MTRTGANTYTLTIAPSIREFYAVPAEEQILKLAFVFRNDDASRTGRDVGGADIFHDVSQESAFDVRLVQPDLYSSLVYAGQVIPVQASASVCDSIILYQNGSQLKKVTETTLSHAVTAIGSGSFKLVARAWKDNVAKADSAYYFIRTTTVTQDVPAGLRPGVNITGDNSAAFLLYAPSKSNVFVMSDFNNWAHTGEGFMKRSPDGNWYWLEVTGLDPDEEYGFQYLIDETLRIPDPYTTKVLDPWNDKWIEETTYPDLKPYPEGLADGLVSVFQTRPPEYVWKNSSYTSPSADTLIIYELLVRDFVETHSFRTIRDTLDYFKRLGVNAIEFMPVNEFDGNSSWGYNPAMYFAVDKYYGPPDEFRELIDSCHSRGIAVIMDLVLNHAYGNNPLVKMYFNSTTGKPAANNPWFNVEAPHQAFKDWGYDFNHESNATKDFVDSVCHFWINEFRVDGFRFDFTKGFTNKLTYDDWSASGAAAYDPSRIAILKRIGSRIRTYKPDAILILEHFTDNSEEKELAANNFLLWGDGKWRYREASTGRSSDLSEASWKSLGWDRPGIVDYMESHDQERIMYLNLNEGLAVGGYNIKDFNTAIKRVKLTATFFLTIPGPKMLWQFQELGYDYILGEGFQRLEEKPIRWDYYDVATRNNLYNNFAALIELRKNQPAFSSDNFTLYQSGMTKRLNIQHSDMDVVVLGNFDLFPRSIDPNFTRTGTWYEFFRGTALDVSAANQNTPISLLQGEYRLYTSKRVDRPSFLTGIGNQFMDDDAGVLFDVYPNPFRASTVIKFGGDYQYQPHKVELISASGAVVKMINAPTGIDRVTLDGSDLASGIYYLKVTSGRASSVKRLVRY
jgi:1,4-alpha-glucan branching enzyme